MGGGSSKGEIQARFRAATENPERIRKFTEKLKITEAETFEFFRLYDKVDRDNSGEISLDEFFKLFDLDFTGFGKNIFSAMDISGDNKVEFVEFFIGLWNYCTLEKDSLLKFSFDLFDLDGSGEIDSQEFKKLVSMIHGNKQLDAHATKLMKTFDKDRSGSISFKEFLSNAKNTPSLFMEAYTLQRKMRTRCMGTKYWNKATRRRAAALPQNKTDLHQVYYKLYHNGESLVRLNLKKETQKRKPASLNYKGMTKTSKQPLYAECSRDTKRVGKVVANEEFFVVEEIEVSKKNWVKVEAVNGTGWIMKKYVLLA